VLYFRLAIGPGTRAPIRIASELVARLGPGNRPVVARAVSDPAERLPLDDRTLQQLPGRAASILADLLARRTLLWPMTRAIRFWQAPKKETMMKTKAAVAGALGALALAGAAVAQPLVQPAKNVQMPRSPSLECSVTSGGPDFNFGQNVIDMSYGGGVSCKGGIGHKSLNVSVQVAGSGPNRGRFFTITGSQRSVAGSSSPIRINVGREAVLGHAYRVVARGKVTFPNGFAGCSLHVPPACTEAVSATAVGPLIAP
jgi:hypothetical protein